MTRKNQVLTTAGRRPTSQKYIIHKDKPRQRRVWPLANAQKDLSPGKEKSSVALQAYAVAGSKNQGSGNTGKGADLTPISDQLINME